MDPLKAFFFDILSLIQMSMKNSFTVRAVGSPEHLLNPHGCKKELPPSKHTASTIIGIPSYTHIPRVPGIVPSKTNMLSVFLLSF